jgi:integrase
VPERYIAAHPGKHYYLKILVSTLGTKPLVDVTGDDIEHAADVRQAHAKKGSRGGLDARRHLLTSARHLFNWAIKKKITRSTPFRVEGTSVIDVGTSRSIHRRLEADEELRLLAAADDYTKDRITAALELGGRGGELLSITWADVHEDVIVLTTRKTKDGQPNRRELPISVTLRQLLDRRRVGPDGEALPASAFVFGNAVGERVRRRLAHELWNTTREKAGIPKVDGRFTLHFHDLRREFGSQLLESGAALHEVRNSLGHSNIGMTSTYLKASVAGLKTSFDNLAAARQRRKLRIV